MFGTSLEEVMEMQKEKFPEYRMPWVVQALVDAVLQLQGPSTEGIFRWGTKAFVGCADFNSGGVDSSDFSKTKRSFTIRHWQFPLLV